MDSLVTILDLLTRADFMAGLALGTIGVLLLTVLTRERTGGWGWVTMTAGLVALTVVVGFRDGLLLGIGILAAGGWFLAQVCESSARRVVGCLSAWAVIAVGALVVTTIGGLRLEPVVRVIAPALVVLAGWSLSRWHQMPQRWLLGPLFAFTSFGIWITVPDTELARILLGVALPMSIATTEIGRHHTISVSGSFALAGLVIWMTLIGGTAREASVIGAWGAFGVILLMPLLRDKARSLTPVHLFATHLVVVLLSTRVIGLWQDPAPALAAVAALFAGSYVVLAWLAKGRRAVMAPDSP